MADALKKFPIGTKIRLTCRLAGVARKGAAATVVGLASSGDSFIRDNYLLVQLDAVKYSGYVENIPVSMLELRT